MEHASPLRPGLVSTPVSHDALVDGVRRLARSSVMVVGDAMLDRYIFGEARRISREAPVPVLQIDREVAVAGGAASLVRALTALGTAVAFVSVVGDDQAGSDLTGLIGGQPGVEPWLLVEGGRTTTLKTRFVAGGQHLLRADREESQPIQPKLAERLLRICRDAMAATSITVLSDYGKGVLASPAAEQLIATAHAAGRRVIVDPRGADYARYAGADVITPTLFELGAATRMPVETEADVIAAAAALRETHSFGAVVVSRPEHEVTVLDASGIHHMHSEGGEAPDASWAGNALVAALSAGIAAGLDLPLAARIARLAAAIAADRPATSVVREADLLAALSEQGGAQRKVVTRAHAAEQVERWRARGWRIGFTNGCFDLLHPGHVHLLEQARATCDRLVVGLNGDASVTRLKGEGRPVQTQDARAAVLASLSFVDLVCVFDEDTPVELLQSLQPDVLIKGADYALDAVIGADLVQGWGGSVKLAELLPGHSTSATVERLRG